MDHEQLPAIVWQGEPSSGRFTQVSAFAEELLGYAPELWLREEFWARHLHPDDASRVIRLRAERLAAGLGYSCEYRMIAADGRVVWLHDSARIEREHGRPVRVHGVTVELCDRPADVPALSESEARYRDLYLRTPVMMHSIDDRGRLVDVSNAWLERLGYTREEVVGRPSVEFLTPASREFAEREVLPEYFRTGVVKDIEYQFVRKDGEVLDILLSAVAQRDAAGRFERSLAVLVDITERKRAEQALRRSEAQLRQAQKMEAIGRLAGGIAHDFNNLLVVILGNAELLSMQASDDPAARAYVEQIVSAGERASALTRQILTFSRQQIVRPRLLDLNELIRDTEAWLRRLLREDIEVVTDLQPALGRVCMDPGQATQVVLNLVVNANDAMPEGGRLVIETANVSLDESDDCERGDYVLLTVTDTGVGMDTQTQARLFEPFFTTKGPGRGTGLGLATVHGIVRALGGCITVYSEPGRGTSFRVHLPRVEPAEAEVRVRRAAEPRQRCVLVVEADEMVAKIVADMLRENDYAVRIARDPDQAAASLAERGCIDVVLADLVIVGLSPASFTARVRERHPEAQVIYMAGYVPVGADADLLEQQEVLAKPFTMNGLLRKLEAVCARVSSAAGDAPA